MAENVTEGESTAKLTENGINPVTGFLGKLFDTGLEVFRLREETKRTIGTSQPSIDIPSDQFFAEQPDIGGPRRTQVVTGERQDNLLPIVLITAGSAFFLSMIFRK